MLSMLINSKDYMISEIQFPFLRKSRTFSYAKDVAFFKKKKSVKLKPGLNILFGPNGCGKSTILRMAALSLAAEQGGVSTVTIAWVRQVVDCSSLSSKEIQSFLEGVNVVHDGQPVMFGNPRNEVGLVRGGGFDDDFMQSGMESLLSEASTGHTTMQRIQAMLAVSQNDAPFPTEVPNRVNRDCLNDVWQNKLDGALRLLQGTIPKCQQTLIFDEPESGLAIPAQGNLFNCLYKAASQNNFQVIVATHSAFALGIPGAHYIEMEPGYLQHSAECINHVHLQLSKVS